MKPTFLSKAKQSATKQNKTNYSKAHQTKAYHNASYFGRVSPLTLFFGIHRPIGKGLKE